MTTLDILTAYRATVQEIAAIDRQLQLCALPNGPAPLENQRYGGIGRNTNEPTAAALQTIDGLEEMLLARRAYLLTIAAAFEGVVQNIADPETAVIIRRYYGLGETDAQVAEAVEKSAMTVYRIRRRFISAL